MEKKVERAQKIVAKAKPKAKSKAKPKARTRAPKRRTYTRKPKTHMVVVGKQVPKRMQVKTDMASNVWATYDDDDGYTFVTHLPSGLNVYLSTSFIDAREVMTDLGKEFRNWNAQLDLGEFPSNSGIQKIRKFLEQYE